MLYRVSAGQSCVLSMASLFSGMPYPADAMTEVETHAIAVPSGAFLRAFEESPDFRSFVVTEHAKRVHELIVVISGVTFRRVDVRAAEWLLKNRNANEIVEITHKSLADELGTSREVVSRLLKSFENRRWITLSRKRTTIVDSSALENFLAANQVAH